MPREGTLRNWLTGGELPTVRTPLTRALLDREAYRIAQRLEAEQLGRRALDVKREIEKALGIRIPVQTVYYWITNKSRPNIAQVHICPELSFVLGYLVEKRGEKWMHCKEAKLKVRDPRIIEKLGSAMTGGYAITPGHGAYTLRVRSPSVIYLLKTRLYEVLKLLWPKEFEEGKRIARDEGGERNRGAAKRRRPDTHSRRLERRRALHLTYEAVRLLRGLLPEEALEILERARTTYDLPVVKIGKLTVLNWLSKDEPKWYIRSPLVKSLEKCRPYKPIKLCPELGYWLGAYLSDGGRSNGYFELVDSDFAEKIAAAATSATDVIHRVRSREKWDTKRKCYTRVYAVSTYSTALKYLASTRLYIIVALRYREEFARGLFDGDGGIWVGVTTKEFKSGTRRVLNFALTLTLNGEDPDLLAFAKRFLENEFGIPTSERRKRGEKTVQLVTASKKSLWTFASRIGFSVKRKDERLRDLLGILRYKNCEKRAAAWLSMYEKRNGRWIKKTR